MDDRAKKAKSRFALMVILVVVGVAAFAVMYVGTGLNDGNIIMISVGVGVIAFILSAIAGGSAHRNVDKNGSGWEKIVYTLTFPSYVASYLLFAIFGGLAAGIKQAWNKADPSAPSKSENDNIIIKNNLGREIELHFIDRYTYYNCKLPGELYGRSDHPFYGKSYLRYSENSNTGAGPFWMSFDEGKTFVREDEFNPYIYKN